MTRRLLFPLLVASCVPYDVVVKGEGVGAEDSDPTDCTGDMVECCRVLSADLARDPSEAEALLTAFPQIDTPDHPPPVDLSGVDWATRSLVAVYTAGICPSTGYQLHVGRLSPDGDNLVIHGHVSDAGRGDDVTTRPFELLLANWTGTTVEAR